MNPAQLLAQFDRISDAPDAIPRLRRFILDLAVRGKLVEQDPRDEPASELLKRIQAEKERLTKDGKVKQQKSLLPLTELELPFSIPNSWVWVQLDRLTEKITDGEHLSPNKTTAGMPLLTATHVTSQGVTLNNPQFVSIEDGHKSRQRCDPHRGDILICSRGTIGRCAVVNTDETFCLMGSVILARFPKETSPAYFNYFLSTDRAQMQMRGMSGATAVQALYLKDIRLCPVALPPLAEQHRIVAKVDELMALCDRLEASQAEQESRRDRLAASSLDRLNNGADADAFREHARFYFNHLPRLATRLEHIQQLRQTILSLAVRGQLVPQDPNDEPAAQLMAHIRSEVNPSLNSRKQLLGQSAANRSIELPYEIPIQWSWIRLGDLLPEFQNGVSSRGEAQGTPTTVLRLADIKDGEISLADTREMLLPDNAGSKYKLENGDTLIVRVNGSADIVGRLVVCRENLRAIYCDHFIRMRVRSSWVTPKFLGILGDSPLIRDQIGSLFITTAGQKTVNQGHISALQIPLPPLAEQHRIVAKIEELMALCDRLEAQLATTQSKSRRLLEAVLHEALASSEGRAVSC